MKTKKTRIRELRGVLRYWQMMVRMDIKSLERTKNRCKEVAEQLRKLQAEADEGVK